MRTRFTWGQDLSDSEFGRAVLVLGLLPPSTSRLKELPAAEDIAGDLISRRDRHGDRPWAWRLRRGVERLVRGVNDARLLAEAGEELVTQARSSRLGLRIEANLPKMVDPVALMKTLQDSGVQSVYVRCRQDGDITWTWPLRLAVDSDGDLLDDIHQESSLRRLYRPYDVGHLSRRANLALFADSLASAHRRLQSSRRRPGADAIVLFGGLGVREDGAADLVAELRALSGAQAVVVFETKDGGQARSAVVGLLTELSHDLPLDAAAGRVASNLALPVLTWAGRNLVTATSLSEQGRMLAQSLRKLEKRISIRRARPRHIGDDEPMAPPDAIDVRAEDLFTTYDLPHARVDAGALGDELARRLPQAMPGMDGAVPPDMMSFDAESGDATIIAEVADAASDAISEDLRRRERRYLQARVQTPGGRPVGADTPLRPNRRYEACVFIGAPRQLWLGLGKPLDEPPPRPDGRPLTLQVMFWEPSLEKGPVLVPLKLYPEGDTSVVRFPFTTPSELRTFWVRIAVYHRNRVLQTGVLQATVDEIPCKLTFTPDAAPLPRFVGLEDRAEVGASIIFNDDPSGDMQAYVHAGGTTAVVNIGPGATPPTDSAFPAAAIDPARVGDVDQLVDTLGRYITRITANPDDYSALKKEGTRKLLINLAQHGAWLLEGLLKDPAVEDVLKNADHLQVVQARTGAFFPLEYLYSGEMPGDDAEICSCLDDPGDISDDGRCAAYEGKPRQTVCPLKFWSLSRVIERHARLIERSELEDDAADRPLPASERQRVLHPLTGAVLAASDKVDKEDSDTLANLHAALEDKLQKPVPVAEDWDKWTENIGATSPHLLVLLPHHDRSDNFELLVIGAGKERKVMLIRDEDVRSPANPEISPVVLLIGCETAMARIDFENSVEAFRRRGAAIIVSTIATILGRQAGPVAAAIVEELQNIQDQEDATFGQAMLAVRRRLLAEGTPMVLGLTSYGDADWRIASNQS